MGYVNKLGGGAPKKRTFLSSGAMVGAMAVALFGQAAPQAQAARLTAEPASEPSCGAWRIEYELAGNLTLTNTPHGAGNGTYRVGPGRAVLLVNGNGPQRKVELLEYTMRERLPIRARSFVGSADILADLTTQTAEGCDVARGVLSGDAVTWTSRAHGYQSDGTIFCSGSLCGNFGAPPPGSSGFHLPPQDVPFGAFVFSPDRNTFAMQDTFVETSAKPQQTAHIALSGREAKRECVGAGVCP